MNYINKTILVDYYYIVIRRYRQVEINSIFLILAHNF